MQMCVFLKEMERAKTLTVRVLLGREGEKGLINSIGFYRPNKMLVHDGDSS